MEKETSSSYYFEYSGYIIFDRSVPKDELKANFANAFEENSPTFDDDLNLMVIKFTDKDEHLLKINGIIDYSTRSDEEAILDFQTVLEGFVPFGAVAFVYSWEEVLGDFRGYVKNVTLFSNKIKEELGIKLPQEEEEWEEEDLYVEDDEVLPPETQIWTLQHLIETTYATVSNLVYRFSLNQLRKLNDKLKILDPFTITELERELITERKGPTLKFRVGIISDDDIEDDFFEESLEETQLDLDTYSPDYNFNYRIMSRKESGLPKNTTIVDMLLSGPDIYRKFGSILMTLQATGAYLVLVDDFTENDYQRIVYMNGSFSELSGSTPYGKETYYQWGTLYKHTVDDLLYFLSPEGNGSDYLSEEDMESFFYYF